MAKLFFFLSGENETLPAAELFSILEAEGFVYEIKEKLDQVIRLESDICSSDIVQLRSAYTRICALELFNCDAEDNAIKRAISKVDFGNVLSEGQSFAVRIRRVKTYAEKKDTMDFERKLGRLILENAIGAKVNLKSPDKIFIGVLTSRRLVFGVKLAVNWPKPFSERRPRKKPFFHPSAMPSKLARCMINLAQARANELVLDPFCGTGSILIEATFVGCSVLGFDIQSRMIKGCRRNLDYFGLDPEGLVIADARQPPIRKIDHIVTDPPYGRSATTMKSTTKQIVISVLAEARYLLNEGQRICIASPKTLNIGRIGKELGYEHLESHFAYVHRTLTREIAVFRKK